MYIPFEIKVDGVEPIPTRRARFVEGATPPSLLSYLEFPTPLPNKGDTNYESRIVDNPLTAYLLARSPLCDHHVRPA